jgi:hypothetical protein
MAILDFFKEMEIMEQWPGFKKIENKYCLNNRHYFEYIPEHNIMRSVQPAHRVLGIYFPLERNDNFIILASEIVIKALFLEIANYFYPFSVTWVGFTHKPCLDKGKEWINAFTVYDFEQQSREDSPTGNYPYRIIIWPL